MNKLNERSLDKWAKHFPKFPFVMEITIPCVEFMGIYVSEGMRIKYKITGDQFEIKAIRLDPTIRFWTGSEWILASSCILLNDAKHRLNYE